LSEDIAERWNNITSEETWNKIRPQRRKFSKFVVNPVPGKCFHPECDLAPRWIVTYRINSKRLKLLFYTCDEHSMVQIPINKLEDIEVDHEPI